MTFFSVPLRNGLPLGLGSSSALTSTIAAFQQSYLVSPAFFSAPPLTLSRAQTGNVQSSAIGSDGSSFVYYGADTPRFNSSAQFLLIEGSRTNSIRNPRAEGAVAGTPGTAPTNWGLFGAGGVNFNIVGTGTENNLPYVDIRISGISTTGASPLIRADQVYPAAAQNQAWTYSQYTRLIAGTLTGITNFNVFVTEWTSGGAFLNQSFSSFTLASGNLSGGRLSVTRTLTGATAGLAGSQFTFSVSVGVAIDATVRIGAPQLELGSFASSPILPPAGTPGTSTRGADIANSTLANFGVSGNGACTVLWSGVLPRLNTTTGLTHFLCTIDDGSLSNRYVIRNASGASLNIERNTGGVSSQASSGTLTAGVPFSTGFSIDSLGRMAASLNGAAVFAVTGGPVSGLTTFRLGSNLVGGANMFGETNRLQVFPYSVTDAELQYLVGTLP